MPFEQVAIIALFILGLFALNGWSRAALRKERIAAEKLIRSFRGPVSDGTCLIDGSVCEIAFGSEDVHYRHFELTHYSRRFLLTQGNEQYVAVVTKGQTTPFIKRLDAQRGQLVSGFKEWKPSSFA